MHFIQIKNDLLKNFIKKRISIDEIAKILINLKNDEEKILQEYDKI
jgi:uncharacterized protein YeeX (DUF496 family)